MDKKPFSLSLFFPAYNEEQNIAMTIARALAAAESAVTAYEVIIVNDGSTDRTGDIAEAAARQNPLVRVIHHAPNHGYGAAVWSGIRAARHEYVFFSDADLQFDLAELPLLLEHVPEYDAVLGYRAKRRDPLMRLMNAKGWNALNRLLFGLNIRDIDCAFKLFKTGAVRGLPVRSRGAMMSAELLIHLQRQGARLKEIPVTHLPRRAGSPTGARPAVIFRALKEMAAAYFRGLTARRKDEG